MCLGQLKQTQLYPVCFKILKIVLDEEGIIWGLSVECSRVHWAVSGAASLDADPLERLVQGVHGKDVKPAGAKGERRPPQNAHTNPKSGVSQNQNWGICM